MEETEWAELEQRSGLDHMLVVTAAVAPDVASNVVPPPPPRRSPPPASTHWYEDLPPPSTPLPPADDAEAQVREVIRDLVGMRWTFQCDPSALLPPPPPPSLHVSPGDGAA